MNLFSAIFTRDSRKRRNHSSQTRLQFETLESRRLLAAMDLRFVTYNALNFDSSSGNRQDEMAIVFNELDADVLAIQEINTTAGANTLLAALNSNGQQYARANFVDGNDTDNLLFYKTAKVDLVSQNYLSTSLREIGEFTISVADTLINIYSVHLKASTGSDNEQRRLDDVTTLRTHLESLPSDREFIVAGDTNIYTSTEPAYQKLIGSESNNNGRVEDLLPPSLVGNWHNNSAFSSVHSQSPRTSSFGGGATGGMDDRFDMIFSSYGLNDNIGLEYVANSYFVLGNDGQHFNQSILSGSNSAVSPAVAQALHDASDHLPVVADFQVESPIGVAITQSGGSTSVSEAGATDSYQVVLDSAPTANVTIQVTPDSQLNLGNGAGVPVSLTFTPSNALQSQTINVAANDDTVSEGVHFGLIQHAVTSSDTQYNGISVDTVSVSISDNDGSTTPTGALLNEVYVNTPGTDTNHEYVEIAATPSMPLTDLWLLEIEGDGANAGLIDNAQNLSSIVAGSNGLVLLGDNYLTSNPWSGQLGSGTTVANLDEGSIENGSITLLLVDGFSASVGLDLDTNNDGQLDSIPWTDLLDGVGWTDGGSSDHVYSSAILSQASGTPDAATRIVNDSQSNSAASWFNGDIFGTTGTVTYAAGSTNLPTNAVLTPGAVNFGDTATAPTVSVVEVNDGTAQRSTLDKLVVTFDGLVDFAAGAFNLLQRSNGVGVATGSAVTTSHTTALVGGNTVATITFDSSTRSSVGSLVDGNYQLTIDGTKVTRSGSSLTMDTNYVFGDTQADNFYTMYGDINGDRSVSAIDLLNFRQTYRRSAGTAGYDARLDFDGGGTVNAIDLLRFRQNYRRALQFV